MNNLKIFTLLVSLLFVAATALQAQQAIQSPAQDKSGKNLKFKVVPNTASRTIEEAKAKRKLQKDKAKKKSVAPMELGSLNNYVNEIFKSGQQLDTVALLDQSFPVVLIPMLQKASQPAGNETVSANRSETVKAGNYLDIIEMEFAVWAKRNKRTPPVMKSLKGEQFVPALIMEDKQFARSPEFAKIIRELPFPVAVKVSQKEIMDSKYIRIAAASDPISLIKVIIAQTPGVNVPSQPVPQQISTGL